MLGYFTIGKQVEIGTVKGVRVMAVVLGIKFKKPHPSKPKGMVVELAVPNSMKTTSFDLEKEGHTELLAIMGRGPGAKFANERELIDSWVKSTSARQSDRIVRHIAVSYTHLDVYKRQCWRC